MKSVALSFVFSRATTCTPAAFSVFSTSFARPSPYAVASSAIAIFLIFCAARNCATAGPCWSSRPTVRNTFLKPCSVSFGFVAEPEIIGMPAWL